MIGLAMEKWPDDALRRVVDAPLEKWATGGGRGVEGDLPIAGYRQSGVGCLYMHAGDSEYYTQGMVAMGDHACHVRRFDDLRWRFGKPRTVRAIKTRALDILLRRHPLDSRLVVLKAEAVNA